MSSGFDSTYRIIAIRARAHQRYCANLEIEHDIDSCHLRAVRFYHGKLNSTREFYSHHAPPRYEGCTGKVQRTIFEDPVLLEPLRAAPSAKQCRIRFR